MRRVAPPAPGAGETPGRPPGARLVLTTSALIVTSCLAVSIFLGQRNLAQLSRSLGDRGRTISDFLAREAELGVLSGNVAALEKLAETAQAERDVVYSRFFDGQGELLASAGEPPARGGRPRIAPQVEGPEPTTPESGVWEFQAAIHTTASRVQREELGFLDDSADAGDASQPAARSARERVGTVAVGMSLRSLDEQRRLTFLSAALVTVLVALMAVLSAVLLTRRHLQALASAARLAEERAHVAEMKARFVTSASHEFRTPLAVILAASDVIKRYGERMTAAQRAARIDKIQRAVQHMTELLEEVLSLRRAEAGKQGCVCRPVDLRALCEEVVADVKAASHDTHRLVLSTAGAEETVSLDAKLLGQALRNLLTNAVKYSPDGGTVACEVTSANGAIVLRVTDQGIGIPPEDQAHLFEPFHRAANVGTIPGSGLGLAITKKAVELHGGSIRVESTVGCGTTFTVTLPRAPAASISRSSARD